MNLTLKHLTVFVKQMDTGNLSETARLLHRTQPAISSIISGLESELGYSLFLRKKNRLIPTPEAHYFYEHAVDILEKMQQTSNLMKEIGNLSYGNLKVTCLPSISSFVMPRLLAQFLRDKENLTASLMMRSSKLVYEWIASQQYDIGIAETIDDYSKRDTVVAENYQLDCVVAINKSHDLAEKKLITIDDLQNIPLAMPFADNELGKSINNFFSRYNYKPWQKFASQTASPSLEMVEQNVCVDICDAISAESHILNKGENAKVVFRPISPAIKYNVSILLPAQKPPSQITVAFHKVLREKLLEIQQKFGNH